MRVIAGHLGGRRLAGPPRGSKAVRPTSDRAREALFSILGDVGDLSVLDLFCGTGALGIEAISRGADSAIFVDTDLGLVKRNVEALGLERRAELIREDALRYLERSEDRFGLIFCDAPYRLADRLEPELSLHLPARLARFGRAVVESPARRPLDLGAVLELEAEREIGEAAFRVYSKPARRRAAAR